MSGMGEKSRLAGFFFVENSHISSIMVGTCMDILIF